MASSLLGSDHDALGLAELVRQKQVSPRELVDDCIARIERVDHRLGAVVTRMYEQARSAADGPLPDGPFRGVPFLVKDLVQAVAGVRFGRGGKIYQADVPDRDSTLIERYRAAGLVIVAKTKTPELGLTPFTEPEVHGPARNPWSLEHTTGGSSGGSAALVAARVAPMAHGGDGGGSIRIPASCCGLFGLKPTRGRTPVGPDLSENWFGFAIDHAVTLSVRDSAALLDATSGYEPGAPYDAPPAAGPFLDEVARAPGKLRIALCKQPPLPVQPSDEVLRAAEDAARLCAELGHEVEEATLPVDREQFALDFTTLVAVATAVDVDESARFVGRPATHRDFETSTWVVGLLGRTISGARLEHARRNLFAVARSMARFHRRYDVVLSPTLGHVPFTIGALQPRGAEAAVQELIASAGLTSVLKIGPLVDAIAKKTFGFIPYTPLANATGQPSMSVPLASSRAGLPIGIQFSARFGDDATLFRLAAQLEAARPWRDAKPAVHA